MFASRIARLSRGQSGRANERPPPPKLWHEGSTDRISQTAETAGTLHPSARRSLMMRNGTVKFFNVREGWGMIVPDEGTHDHHVSFREIQPVSKSGMAGLHSGQRVEYDLVQPSPDMRPEAMSVKQTTPRLAGTVLARPAE